MKNNELNFDPQTTEALPNLGSAFMSICIGGLTDRQSDCDEIVINERLIGLNHQMKGVNRTDE